jgi:hypothetical protein
MATTTPPQNSPFARAKSVGASAPPVGIPHEAIAKLAFQKWQRRGRPMGDALRDWYEAEAELKAAKARGTS